MCRRISSDSLVRKFCVIAVLLVLGAGASRADDGSLLAPASEISAFDRFCEILIERGFEFDRNRMDAAALEAAAKSVDPRSAVVSYEQPIPISTNAVKLVADRWVQNIGYLVVPDLSPVIASNIVDTIASWDTNGIEGLILDLRGSGGDSLDAVDVAAGAVLAGDTMLYSVKDMHGSVIEKHQAISGGNPHSSAPLLVLVNGETRDGSEILAAVLKRHGRVMVVGSHTFGDDALRRRVTVTPVIGVIMQYGRVCMGDDFGYCDQGVLPDVLVDAGSSTAPAIDDTSFEGVNGRPLTEKAIEDRQLMKQVENDLILRRAVDILLGLKALGIKRVDAVTDDVAECPEDK